MARSDIQQMADRLAAGRRSGRTAFTEGATAGISAERERIAAWHERQAAQLEAALEQVAAEGGTVDIPPRSMAQIHRTLARAIRSGEL